MIIKNGNVYGTDLKFHKWDIRTQEDMICEVAENLMPQPGEELLDASCLYVIPGLTDIHFHGCMGHDFCEGKPEVIQLMADYEESVGVTQICPATMTMSEETLSQISKAAKAHPNTKGAQLVGINMEGPFISMTKRGAQNPKYIHKPDVEMFERLQEESGGLVKLVDIAPEEDGALEFIRTEKDRVVISIAHTDADYDQATEAFRNGARHMTHLYNAMNPIHHRKPGPILAAADTDFTEVEIICDNIHLHPATVRNTFRMFGSHRIIFISDTMEAVGMPDGEYELGGQPVSKRGNLATLADGTIAGSATNLMDCMRTTVREMQIPLETAIECATINPARSIGISDRYGSIAPGKQASIVLLDADLQIKNVINRGKVCEKFRNSL
jgi:N-acetylglucosamine-6-phosphate deacetylase